MRDLYENLVRGALNEEPLTIKETIDEIMTAHISPIIEGYKLHVAENMLGASANTASDETELDDAEEFDDEDEVEDEDEYTDEADADEEADEDDEAGEDDVDEESEGETDA